MRTNSNDANLEDDDGADEEGEERGEATAVVVGDAREVRGELVEVDGARPAPRKRHVEHRRWGRGGIGEHFRMLLFLRWMCLYLSKSLCPTYTQYKKNILVSRTRRGSADMLAGFYFEVDPAL